MKTLAFHTPWAKARKQAGLTLVEVLASITVASVVAGGALAMYTVTTTTQRINSLAESINGLATSTRSMFAASGNYGTAEINAALRAAGKVPTALTGTGSTINHPLGGGRHRYGH